MSRLREDLLRALESVEVYPEEHKNRFRSWLANVKDWTISRSRVWGTPLPIWRCVDDPQKILVVGSLEELRKYAVKLPDVDDDKLVHRPWIDSVELRTEDCSRWVREPFVVDVWIDSGVAWIASIDGLRNVKLFEVLYPYTFITEAVDQTRGWFYSLLATSVIDRGTAPYRQIMVQGHVLDKFGRKMSKHLGNVVYAEEAIKRFGVDPLRLYLLSRYPPGESFMFDPEEIRKTTMGVLNILWNVFRFAHMYMSLDGFSPKVHRLEKYLSRLLPEDRWVLSRVNSVSEEFENFMSRYEIHKALQRVIEFAVEELSRTYLKLVRPRVWSEEGDDRFVVYSVLYYVLKRLLKMLAPAVPYVSEALWLRFFKVFEPEELESVHLARLDPVDRILIDRELEERFSLALSSVEALASLRNRLGIKIRWPLAEAVVASAQVTDKLGPLASVIARLANVKTVTLSTDLGVCSERGYEVQEGKGVMVCLPKSMDRELFREAIAREVVRRVQVMRKEAGLSISDYIEVAVESDSDEVLDSVRALENYIVSEVRASKMLLGAPSSNMYVKTWDIEGLSVRIGIRKSVSP